MDWFGFFVSHAWMFMLLGMAQQKEMTYKEKFNLAHSLMLIHQRAIIVTSRRYMGVDALGFPCFFALILMCLWFVATHDPFMLLWIVFWLLCLAKRRFDAIRYRGKMHTRFDGLPNPVLMAIGSEGFAKLVLEPLLVGALGFGAFKFYQYHGWSPTGLPYFLFTGCVSLPFVEVVNQTIWRRRIDGMANARLENEALIRDFRDNYS